MGYRSQVIIGFAFADRAAVDLFAIKLQEPQFNEIRQDIANDTKWFDNGGEISALIEFEHVKWYPDYPYVQQFHALLQEIDENWEGLAGAKFIRSGEDDNDTESECYGGMGGEIELHLVTRIESHISGQDYENPLKGIAPPSPIPLL